MNDKLKSRRDEFFASVWDHSVDKFQTAFDECRDLNPTEVALLRMILGNFADGASDDTIAERLRHHLASESSEKLIEVLLQLCGITRNKILQDIKASAGERRKELKLGSHLDLAYHIPTWNLAGPYLVRKLRKIFHHPRTTDPVVQMLSALNQATWPGYIRQERAKRSGHEAEYRIATLLSRIGIPFVPEEKADNPLCPDAAWKGVSFDIIVPDSIRPQVCIKSTVHTSNIGQYGESKDHLEIDEARRMIDSLPPESRPLLVGFIDGIGFESNSAGLNGILEKADEFCQFSTIWKLGVISASRIGKRCSLFIPPADRLRHQAFLMRYKDSIREELIKPKGGIEAGRGVIKIF
jgi:hypothetical protein